MGGEIEKMVEIRFKPSDIGTVADGAVTTAKLADNAVTNPKVADNAIDTAEIADNAIIASKILDGEVKEIKVESKKFVKTGPLSGDKLVTSLAFDSATSEIVLDHEDPPA